jgi:hypothetical protein
MPKKNFTPVSISRGSDGLLYFVDASGAAKRFTVKELDPTVFDGIDLSELAPEILSEVATMIEEGTAADVNPAGPQIAEALDTKLNSNYDHLTYFGDASGVVTMKNIIGELASGDVPAGSELVQIGNSVTSIGDYALYGWGANNQPLVIPDSVTSIGYYTFAFWGSNNQPLVIGDSVTEIGDHAFPNWSDNNQPLVIPDSVTSIGDYAFGNWYGNYQPLVIGNSVETIGDDAFFYWNVNNNPLVIPDSVTSIGNNAFKNWDAMTEPIYCGFNFSAFTGVNAFEYNGATQIYVKPGATGWTIGAGQTIQGAYGITVSNWDNYPNPIPN